MDYANSTLLKALQTAHGGIDGRMLQQSCIPETGMCVLFGESGDGVRCALNVKSGSLTEMVVNLFGTKCG